MKKYLSIMLVLVLALGITSCEDEQDEIESTFVGRSWTGDVGMDAENGEPLFSTFIFGADGFGKEYQFYNSNGEAYEEFNFQWYWEDDYSRNLVLDYGKNGVSFMNDLRVSGSRMRGVFYLFEGDRGFDFVLDME